MTHKMDSLLEIYSMDELSSLLKTYDIDYLYDFSSPREVAISSIQKDIETGDFGVYLDSPDGYVEANQWVDKGHWQEWVVEFDNTVLRVNENHLFETRRGWVKVKDLEPEDKILHESGTYVDVKVYSTDIMIPIVDIQIDHPNHRYYAEGLSSHNTNVGKSSLMCYLAGEWLKSGKNVLYISMEMSEEAVQERIDANLLDMSTSDLKNPDLDKDLFVSKVKKLKERTVGSLIVKEYPTSGAHAGHFRHLLKELRQKKKFRPDVIFVDYINICLSSRFKSGSNANSYTIVKSIAEELRGLAVEFEVPLVTATQVTRTGYNAQSIDLTDTSESFGLPATADLFFGIVTNEELMEMGRQVVMLLKTRFGNKSNVKAQTIKVDFDRMRYSDVETDSYEEVKNSVSHSPGIIEKQNRMKSGIPNDITWD